MEEFTGVLKKSGSLRKYFLDLYMCTIEPLVSETECGCVVSATFRKYQISRYFWTPLKSGVFPNIGSGLG